MLSVVISGSGGWGCSIVVGIGSSVLGRGEGEGGSGDGIKWWVGLLYCKFCIFTYPVNSKFTI